MGERREFVRRAIERVVLVAGDDAEGVVTFMRDISQGGLSLAWVPGIPVTGGATLTLELPLGSSRSRIKTTGIVRAVSHDAASDSARVHLQFSDTDPLFRRLIAETLVEEASFAA